MDRGYLPRYSSVVCKNCYLGTYIERCHLRTKSSSLAKIKSIFAITTDSKIYTVEIPINEKSMYLGTYVDIGSKIVSTLSFNEGISARASIQLK